MCISTASSQHVCHWLSSENIMLTLGDIEMDFLFGKERSDGDPWPGGEWFSFTLFPLVKIPASVFLLLRFLTARRSRPDPEACRDRACTTTVERLTLSILVNFMIQESVCTTIERLIRGSLVYAIILCIHTTIERLIILSILVYDKVLPKFWY